MSGRPQKAGQRWRGPAGRDLTEKEREDRRRHRQKYDQGFRERQGALPEPPKKKKKNKKCIVM
jgi:hypothetical protein